MKTTNHTILSYIFLLLLAAVSLVGSGCQRKLQSKGLSKGKILSKADGYRGIWYKNQNLDNEYIFKYSGGLSTYCAKHQPFAIYSKEADKTFFCYGGTVKDFHLENADTLIKHNVDMFSKEGALLHMVAYYNHKTGKVPKPTILLDKATFDAHDNPVITLDNEGYIWIFSTAHGTLRPSYIHKSKQPYDIQAFERIDATRYQEGKLVPFDNFSYMQAWHNRETGFTNFMTSYESWAGRAIFQINSTDGKVWDAPQMIASFGEGHYQISAANGHKICSVFNYHPSKNEQRKGLNYRTNLYYVESKDQGKSWQAIDGTALKLPLSKEANNALVKAYEEEEILVYLKDIQLDEAGHPVVLFITSKGFETGPENNPRTWNTAYWNGKAWEIKAITTSDCNYDMGSIYLEKDGTWRIIAPTETGPQPFNPGGEVAMWTSKDKGESWTKEKQLTRGSERNHTYVRRPVNANPEFYGFWADGDGRAPSVSRLYFCNKAGEVFQLPALMDKKLESPQQIK